MVLLQRRRTGAVGGSELKSDCVLVGVKTPLFFRQHVEGFIHVLGIFMQHSFYISSANSREPQGLS